MSKANLKLYHFLDNNFEMDINVSMEERTIYMNQSEIANLLERSRNLISRRLAEFIDKNASICSKNEHFEF